MSENPDVVSLEDMEHALGFVALAVVERNARYADLLALLQQKIEIARAGDAMRNAQDVLRAVMAPGR